MTALRASSLALLLEASVGTHRASGLLGCVEIPEQVIQRCEERVPRIVLAMAMDLLLFEDLIRRVPFAQAYVRDQLETGRKVMFDHGALRTVETPCGKLPKGHAAFARILEPLGYKVADVYPLDRLAMTGRAYVHQDLPEHVPQFFVSELHPKSFSPAFQAAVQRVVETSTDPLPAWTTPLLDELRERESIAFNSALRLLPNLLNCFDRQHQDPHLIDYETILAESPEMAWICTEGNAFNHGTDRVEDVVALSDDQKSLGRPMKQVVEFSASGRVIQTAYRATEVQRVFIGTEGNRMLMKVPGSFFEFITRKPDANGKLDLHFDAGNAQAIFKMTSAQG